MTRNRLTVHAGSTRDRGRPTSAGNVSDVKVRWRMEDQRVGTAVRNSGRWTGTRATGQADTLGAPMETTIRWTVDAMTVTTNTTTSWTTAARRSGNA